MLLKIYSLTLQLPSSLLVFPRDEGQLENTAPQLNASFHACASLGTDCWATAVGRIGGCLPQKQPYHVFEWGISLKIV